MDFDAIFTAFYTGYRAEATVPSSTDDEYTIAKRFANEAINRWANYDGVYWKELFDTNQVDGTGDQTVVTSQTQYTAPTNMREAGGLVKIVNSAGNTVRTYQIIEPNEAQFRADNSTYCYFTGNPSTGFTLHLNPAPDASISGMDIDYVYYKKPTQYTTGSSKSEVSNAYFVVNHMLANRFRASRNWGAYQTALRDAEDSLKGMKMDNDSGNWAAPWKIADNSGSVWGDGHQGGFF